MRCAPNGGKSETGPDCAGPCQGCGSTFGTSVQIGKMCLTRADKLEKSALFGKLEKGAPSFLLT